jgi:hypothetical protein
MSFNSLVGCVTTAESKSIISASIKDTSIKFYKKVTTKSK